MNMVKVIFKELIPFVIIFSVVVLIRTFIATPVKVDGTSMLETLHNKEVLLLEKRDRNFERFDIVVIQNGDERIIKRVIGLPGEYISFIDGQLYVNNELLYDRFAKITPDFLAEKKIPDDEYFVMGDNRTGSMDSRVIGNISYSQILGKTKLRLYPFNKIGTFN